MSKKIFFGLLVGVLFFIFISCEDVKVADYTTNPANKSILKSSGDEPPQARVYHNQQAYEDIFSTDRNEQAKTHRSKGDIHLKKSEYDDAIKAYTQAINLYKDDEKKAYMYFRRAFVYRMKEDYEKAIRDYTEVMKLSSNSKLLSYADICRAHGYVFMGSSYYNKGQYTKAIEAYTQAIKLHKDDGQKAYVYYSRALAYSGRKDYAEAIEDYTEVIKLSTSDTLKALAQEAYHRKGDIHLRQNEFDNAIYNYTRALALLYKDDQKKASVYYKRGRAYFHKNKKYYRDAMNYKKAISDYTKAMNLSTDDVFKEQVLMIEIAKAENKVKSIEYFKLLQPLP